MARVSDFFLKNPCLKKSNQKKKISERVKAREDWLV